MSSYRSVNFHDLCRICTAHAERRINVFSAESKNKNLCSKLSDCLPLMMDEKDRLPKVVCEQCLNQVDDIYKFRNICKNSQNMLSECLKQAAQHNSGKVYIKDAIAPNSGKSLSVINNANSAPNFITTMTHKNGTNMGTFLNNNNEIIHSLMQSIAVQPSGDINQTDRQQFTNYSKSPSNPQTMLQENKEAPSIDSDNKSLTEFLKLKPNIKITPLGKNNSKKVEEVQQQLPQQQIQQQLQQQHLTLQQTPQQFQFHPTQIQQMIQSPEQLVQIQHTLSTPTNNNATAANIQLQQLQHQLQQFQLQQQLQQQIQQITSQLQPQPTITFSAPSTPCSELSPSKSKKPKLNFVLTSPTSQTLTATLPQLAMTANGGQQPQIQLQLQSPQSHSQTAAATLFSNLAPLLQQQQQQQQTQIAQQSTNTLQAPTTTSTSSTMLLPSPNKCYLPITIKDENSSQEYVAQIDAKNFLLPTTYQLQMKLQPQLATVDGQPIMQLTPTSIPATLQLSAPALNNQTFQGLSGGNNMLQATLPIQTQMQQKQQQQQQPQMQHHQDTPKTSGQITSHQIIRAPLQLTNDAATSTSDQFVEFFPNNIDSTKEMVNQEAKRVIQQKRYIVSQQSGTGVIDITPSYSRQIMQSAQHQQQKQQKVEQQEQRLLSQSQLRGVPTTIATTQQQGATAQRMSNTSAMKQTTQQQPTHSLTQRQKQQQSLVNRMQDKVPILQKKDVTISRISTTPQTPQQQQQQHQALLKLLPTTKLEVKPNETAAKQTQIQKQQQTQQTLIKKVESVVSQEKIQALVASTTPAKVEQKSGVASPQQQQQNSQLPNLMDHITETATTTVAATDTTSTNVPSLNVEQQQANINSAETSIAKGKIQGIPAHGVGPNGLECSQCGRAFKKKEHLTQHVKLHAGLRPFKCKEEQCGKAFSRKEHLMRHEISHSGRKLFSCDICHKPFSRKDNLSKHRRIHTSITEVYTCEICSKEFVVKAYYEEHKQMHEESDSAEPDNTNNPKPTKARKSSNAVSGLKNTQQLIRLQPQMQFQQQQQQQQQNQQQQQQQFMHPTMTAIPPSLISTNQPQAQQIQIVQQSHQTGNTQYQQQQSQQQQQIMQLQLPTVVSTQDLAGNTITITQSNDQTLKATIGNNDAAILNIPSTLANLMQLSHAQFVNTATGQIMGQIKIEK